jgi:hypothetical protein
MGSYISGIFDIKETDSIVSGDNYSVVIEATVVGVAHTKEVFIFDLLWHISTVFNFLLEASFACIAICLVAKDTYIFTFINASDIEFIYFDLLR